MLLQLAQKDIVLVLRAQPSGSFVAPDIHNAPVRQLNHRVAVVVHQIRFVRHQQHQVVPRNLLQQVHHQQRVRLVQVAGRLVGKDDARILDNGARNRNALLLTARQRIRRTGGEILHADVRQRRRDPLAHLPALLHAAQAQRVRNVVKAGFALVEVVILEDIPHLAVAQRIGIRADVLPVNRQAAARKAVQTADDVEQRGLAAAAAPENGNHAALGQLQTDIVDHVDFVLLALVKKLVQMLNPNHSASPPFKAFLTLCRNSRRICLCVTRTVTSSIPTHRIMYCHACRYGNSAFACGTV